MTEDQAETIALQALAWLVSHEELRGVFLGATGSSAEDIRAQAADPSFQASVLEFLTMDDAWIIAFCDESGLGYDKPLAARYALPGAAQVHWT